MRSSVVTALFCLLLTACGAFSGGGARDPFESRATVMGVNGYLWQATLDTLEFMPIASADQSAGLILTEWFISPGNPNERVKLTVRFLTDQLRSDAVRVLVQREVRQGSDWVFAQVQAATALTIEEAILNQARTLKIEAEDS